MHANVIWLYIGYAFLVCSIKNRSNFRNEYLALLNVHLLKPMHPNQQTNPSARRRKWTCRMWEREGHWTLDWKDRMTGRMVKRSALSGLHPQTSGVLLRHTPQLHTLQRPGLLVHSSRVIVLIEWPDDSTTLKSYSLSDAY